MEQFEQKPVPADVQEQIDMLNSKLTKQSINVTAESGFTVTNNYSYQIGNLIILNFRVQGTITPNAKIATIPSAKAPGNTYYPSAVDISSDTLKVAYISSVGAVYSVGTAGNLQIQCAYVI